MLPLLSSELSEISARAPVHAELEFISVVNLVAQIPKASNFGFQKLLRKQKVSGKEPKECACLCSLDDEKEKRTYFDLMSSMSANAAIPSTAPSLLILL